MDKETIRWIDVRLGSLVCACLTLHRRLFERRGAPSPAKRILFIKFIEQGATVLAYDAIARAIELVGAENVFFVVFSENRPILDILDVIPGENILEIRAGRFSEFVFDAFRALRLIRARQIDATIDMEFLARASAIFGYLSGARIRVGLHRYTEEAPYRGDLLTHRVWNNPFLHCARSYRLLVDALAGDPSDTPMLKAPSNGPAPALPSLRPTQAERDAVARILLSAGAGAAAGPRVILNPNAGDLLPLRKWPTDRFVALARGVLAARPDVTVIVTGAPSEADAAAELAAAIGSPRALSVAGKTTLREVLVLYDLCDVLVTNDSGPGHFASLTHIDSVVLFGPGSPRQYGPIGPRSTVLYADLACSPCANVYNHRFSPCTNNVCMQAISVEEVLQAVLARLASRALEAAP